MLPVHKGEQASEQRSNYRHIELYEEDVPEETCVPAGTLVLRFLLLGDQNAGKTTFLQTFTRRDDRNFTALQSFLPFLSATFLNQRFLGNDECTMDEPPFLDTDVGKANVLLSVSDFVFFSNEFQLPPVDLDPMDRYVNLQLDELGGDHLDRLVHPTPQSNQLEEILRNSLELITKAKRIVYFINCKELLPDGRLSKIHVDVLKARLTFLADHGVPEILFYCSRVPDEIAEVAEKCTIPSLPVQSAPFEEDVTIDWATEKKRLEHLAQSSALQLVSSIVHGFGFKVVGIHGTQNLTPEGLISVAPVVSLVAHLLAKPDVGGVLSDDFVDLFTHAMVDLRKKNEVWLSAIEWAQLREDCEESATPAGALVQMWPAATDEMVRLGILRRLFSHSYALPQVGIICGSTRHRPPADHQSSVVCYPFSDGLFGLLTSDPFVRSLTGAQGSFQIRSPGMLESLAKLEKVLLPTATKEGQAGDVVRALRTCCDIATIRSLMGRADCRRMGDEVSVFISIPLMISKDALKGWTQDEVVITPCSSTESLSGFVYVVPT